MDSILLNLLSITRGGGKQVANEFLFQLNEEIDNVDYRWIILKRESTELKSINHSKIKIINVRNGLLSRLKFELIDLPTIIYKDNIKLIFTLFGTIPLIKQRNDIYITGNAYSNLFVKELKFWTGLNKLNYLKKKLIDYYRILSIKLSDVVILENYYLLERATELFKNKFVVIKPSINQNALINKNINLLNYHETRLSKKFKILYLAGYHPNKRHELLINISMQLKENDIRDIAFIITLDNSKKKVMEFMNEVQSKKLSEYLINIGRVEQENIGSLYQQIDASILLSRLESFSNVIIESWSAEVPLIIGDYDWSRFICKNGALYIDLYHMGSAVDKITRLKNDSALYDKIVTNGNAMLKEYPSPKEKFYQYIDLIDEYIKM